MVTKKAVVKVKGLSPLLMHKFPLHHDEDLKNKTPEELCEISAYRNPSNGRLTVPSELLQRAFINGAAYSKGKGRASLQKQAAACMFVTPVYLDLPVESFRIDSRAVVVPATKGRIVRHRPRIDEWTLEFELEWDNSLISETQAREIVDNTGSRVGLMDFRPQTKGPFGRFQVVSWSMI